MRLSGFGVHSSARLCASVRLLGEFKLSVGEDTFIGHETMITGGKCEISIGSRCDISTRVLMIAGSHELSTDGDRVAGAGCSKDIRIGDGCWIGANATILGGVEIGSMSMVAAGAVVTKSIPPRTLVGGVPAKVLRNL